MGPGGAGAGEGGCGHAVAVNGVSPLTAILNQLTMFTVSGTCLPSTIAPTISQCSDLQVTSTGASQATFQCRPSGSSGSEPGQIQTMSGTVLYTFTVAVAPGPPIVTGVTPTVVNYDQLTTFTIDGFGMPSTIAPFITNCAGLMLTSTGANQATFQCTPSFFTGVESGLVKDKSGGTVLYNFEVSVN